MQTKYIGHHIPKKTVRKLLIKKNLLIIYWAVIKDLISHNQLIISVKLWWTIKSNDHNLT